MTLNLSLLCIMGVTTAKLAGLFLLKVTPIVRTCIISISWKIIDNNNNNDDDNDNDENRSANTE